MTRLFWIPCVVLAIGCAPSEDAVPEVDAEAAADAVPDAVTADPAHYAVAFENDAVRLLRIGYGPGETSTLHSHPPTCSILLSDASWRMTDAAGEVTEDTAELGSVECGDEGSVHVPENTGSDRAELILVEMKQDATAPMAQATEHPHAATADPDHYSVEFENDVLRVVRVQYGPGESSVMHSHPAHCIVYLEDQPVTFELPSGEMVDPPRGELGTVNCVDATAHLPTNTGDSGLEVVLVELKGREMASG